MIVQVPTSSAITKQVKENDDAEDERWKEGDEKEPESTVERNGDIVA